MKNIFDSEVTAELIGRINRLTPATRPLWGKMSVSQMLAHCCVSYEQVYENKYPKPGFLKSLLLQLFVKRMVVNETPYKRSIPTTPDFKIQDNRNFEAEKQRLITYIRKTQQLGPGSFENRPSLSFGPLTSQEWNNLFYKHLDHHLNQFGV